MMLNSKPTLTILVLYFLRDVKEARDVLLKLVFFLRKYQSNHNYIYHDVALPFPNYLKDIPYDAIILDVTLMALRFPYNKIYFNNFKKEFEFVKTSDALKIAFPQDEYDCCKILDDWVTTWGVEIVFSALADNPDIKAIYPSFINKGIIEQGYTGYIDDSHFEIAKTVSDFIYREIDVGYRARKLPPYFGKIGETKWRIAKIFSDSIKKYGPFRLDISCDHGDVLLGHAWYNFLANCKFVLGSLSGSSLLDPEGKIQTKVREYCMKNPKYSYEEVERLFFPGEDRYFFTAISPRNIEAAFTRTAQILVKGPYSGILEPWEHYIPFEPDGSNIEEVVSAMKDYSYVKSMINRCFERIKGEKRLYYSTLADKVIEYILQFRKYHEYDQCKIRELINRYNKEIMPKYRTFQKRLHFFNQIRKALANFPMLYNFVYRLYKKANKDILSLSI